MQWVQDKEELNSLPARMMAGEEQAFREFADYFGPRFRSLFMGNGLSAVDAEDLSVSCVSDIALKVDRFSLKKGSGFASWVFTLAKHHFVDLLRVRMADQRQAAAWCDLSSGDETPRMDIITTVRAGLERLSESDRKLIMLRDFDPIHSYDEIGRLLSIRPGTARVRHMRAICRLARSLKEEPQFAVLVKPSKRIR